MALGLSLDKYLTKVLAHHLGIPTPRFVRLDSLADWPQAESSIARLRYPVIAGESPLSADTDAFVKAILEAEEGEEDLTVSWSRETLAVIEQAIHSSELDLGNGR